MDSTPDSEIAEDLVVNKEYLNQLNGNDLLNCPICLGLLYDPVMCENCQNNFCRKCISVWTHNNNTCPFKCQKVNFVPVSRSLRTIMDGLIIKCICGEKVSLLRYPEHKKECAKAKCFNCDIEASVKDLKISQGRNEDLMTTWNIKKYITYNTIKDIGDSIAFHIFLYSKRLRGFVKDNDGWLRLTKNRCEANLFSVYFHKNEKHLRMFSKKKGWLFIGPHYNKGVGVYGSKPEDSIEVDIRKDIMISNSGRTEGLPLTVRIWDYDLYFYDKEPEIYIPFKVKYVFLDKNYSN